MNYFELKIASKKSALFSPIDNMPILKKILVENGVFSGLNLSVFNKKIECRIVHVHDAKLERNQYKIYPTLP